jgi:hypothetical protein
MCIIVNATYITLTFYIVPTRITASLSMWRFELRLNQAVEMNAGHPFRGSVPEVVGSGLRVVQMKDVSIDRGIDWQSATETETSGRREPNFLAPGDILFAIRGNHNYAVLVDMVAADCRSVASPHFFVLRCLQKEMLPEFLVWLLNQEPLQRYFQREAEGTLTKSIRRGALENAPIAIPSLLKQQQIVQIEQAVKQERLLLGKLIQNNKAMMDGIAADLLNGLE